VTQNSKVRSTGLRRKVFWLVSLTICLGVAIGWLPAYLDDSDSDSGMTREIQPGRPEAAPPPDRAGSITESTLHVPIEVPVSEIAKLVNKVVPDSLYHVRDMEVSGGLFGIKLDLDITRNGEIETYTAYGSVFNRIPLAARGRVRIPPGVWRPFESSFVINATTDLTLDEEWNTRSSTNAVITWGDEPVITVAGIKVGLKGASEDALNQQLAVLTPEIDGIIEREVDLRREVDKVWNDLIDPIPIRDDPPMWLSIVPHRTFYSPPESRGDTIVVALWVGATVETIVGDRRDGGEVRELPPLERLPDSLQSGTGAFTVHIPISVSYDDAQVIVARSLKGRTLDIKKNVDLELQDIRLYGSGRSVVAEVDFAATLSETSVGTQGTVFFRGTPAYDSVAQVIRVDSFDYDLNSRNALTEAAAWVLKEGFLDATRDQLKFSIGGEILVARGQLAEALRYRPIGKHIVLSGTLDHLTPGEIYLVDEGINVDIFATGQLQARIRSLDAAVKKVPTLVK
jgi:hypothetical protein